MTDISREACQQAHAMLCINGLPETARLVTALRDALDKAEKREAEARGLPQAAMVLLSDVSFDNTLNEMGWAMNDWLQNNGAKFDGRVFNNLKGFIKEMVETWLKSRAAMPNGDA